MSALTGNPVAVVTAGVSALVSLFSMIFDHSGSQPDPLAEFQADVDRRLDSIAVQLDQVQATLQQVMGLNSEIKMAINDAEFNQVLTQMVQSATVIDNAFSQFGSFAKAITDPNTDANTRHTAAARMYELLTTNPTYGPDKVYEALTNYQRYALGFGGSRGVLSFIPQMVQNGWETCTMKPSQSQDLISAALQDTHGPFHDSVAFVSKQCLSETYTTLADDQGRKVQAVFGTILTEQLKGYAMLSAAYGNSTLDAPQLQQVAAGIQAIGGAMGNMWATIAAPATVDATAQKLFSAHAETLGPARAGEYWWQYSNAIWGDNVPPFNGIPASLNAGFITTSCSDANLGSALPCLRWPRVPSTCPMRTETPPCQ